MNDSQRIVWAEGVFLGQQHFQMLERQVERTQYFRAKTLSPFHWGFVALKIDEDALANGQFRILHCDVIFPDGRLVFFREGNEALACDLTGLQSESSELYLGLPSNGAVKNIAGYQSKAQMTGWSAAFEQVPDEHDTSRIREVMVAHPNLEILRDSEPRDHYSALKVAEVVSEGDGTWRLRNDYVPTVCTIGASPALVALLNRLYELIQARVRVLRERREGLTRIGELGSPDLIQFLLLQVLRPSLATLQHLRDQPELSPESLYHELVTLAAALQGFAAEVSDETLPSYAHNNLDETFARLDELLQRQLSDLAGMPMSGFKLHQETDAIFNVDSVDDRLLNNAGLYLAVQHHSEELGWVNDFVRQAKLGAREDIEMIVGSALPGVRLTHSQRPPSRLPIKSGYEYFRLENHGEFWDRVSEHRSLSLFLPQAFRGARLELVTVED